MSINLQKIQKNDNYFYLKILKNKLKFLIVSLGDLLTSVKFINFFLKMALQTSNKQNIIAPK